MWIWPLLFLAAIVIVVGLFAGTGGWNWRNRGSRPESPGEILDRRYALGEITREQYEEMKRTLAR
jgi:putative membrane protein